MSIRGEGMRADQGFDTSRPVGSFFEVVRGVLLDPSSFFAGLKAARGGSPGRQNPPLIFAIIAGYVALPLSVIVAPLASRVDPLVADEDASTFANFFPFLRENPGLGLALVALFLVFLPLIVLAGSYVGTALQHLFVMLFVRDRETFYATFPVYVYGTGAVWLFAWIPILGYLVNLYVVYVTTVGLKEMHGTTTTRALLAALTPYLIFVLPSLLTLLAAPTSPA